MASPRVWSRDDIMRAAGICRVARVSEEPRETALRQSRYICEILEFAEDNAVLHVDQGRDERGRFLPKPQLHADSAIVVAARAG